ncbi:hypothetical protein [Haloarcula litorea]|uniref:hypothetical protein n=1 Tax=Haloarcula litorea TaxID=3032579 RepID=UPI0023E8201C|nr:hypothetical protein [Halomicroarcula sp. GDY20]
MTDAELAQAILDSTEKYCEEGSLVAIAQTAVTGTERRVDVPRKLYYDGKAGYLPSEGLWVFCEKEDLDETTYRYYYITVDEETFETEVLTGQDLKQKIQEGFQLKMEAPQKIEEASKEVDI